MGPLHASHWTICRSFIYRWTGTSLLLPQPLDAWYQDVDKTIRHCAFAYKHRLFTEAKKNVFEFRSYSERGRTRFTRNYTPCPEASEFRALADIVDLSPQNAELLIINQAKYTMATFRRDTSRPLSFIKEIFQTFSPELRRLVGKID